MELPIQTRNFTKVLDCLRQEGLWPINDYNIVAKKDVAEYVWESKGRTRFLKALALKTLSQNNTYYPIQVFHLDFALCDDVDLKELKQEFEIINDFTHPNEFISRRYDIYVLPTYSSSEVKHEHLYWLFWGDVPKFFWRNQLDKDHIISLSDVGLVDEFLYYTEKYVTGTHDNQDPNIIAESLLTYGIKELRVHNPFIR